MLEVPPCTKTSFFSNKPKKSYVFDITDNFFGQNNICNRFLAWKYPCYMCFGAKLISCLMKKPKFSIWNWFFLKGWTILLYNLFSSHGKKSPRFSYCINLEQQIAAKISSRSYKIRAGWVLKFGYLGGFRPPTSKCQNSSRRSDFDVRHFVCCWGKFLHSKEWSNERFDPQIIFLRQKN
jgi:hypothetical protein